MPAFWRLVSSYCDDKDDDDDDGDDNDVEDGDKGDKDKEEIMEWESNEVIV